MPFRHSELHLLPQTEILSASTMFPPMFHHQPYLQAEPFAAGMLFMLAIVLWMKLVSYHHCCADLRSARREGQVCQSAHVSCMCVFPVRARARICVHVFTSVLLLSLCFLHQTLWGLIKMCRVHVLGSEGV